VPQERQTKDQRRAAAQEAARVVREKQKRKERRNRFFLIGGSTVAILAVGLIVALVLVNSAKPAGPGPENMASDGILLVADEAGGVKAVATDAIKAGGKPTPTDTDALTAKLHIVTYIDYFCPFCNQFETTNAASIQQLVASGTADLEIHPIAILDRSSLGTRYSSRAANAAACVAQYSPDTYSDVNTALFAAQPQEQTAGLTDDELVTVVQDAGVDSADVASCIKDERFKAWVTDATTRALADPALKDPDGNFGTPRVLVNGQLYGGALTDAAAFESFVAQIFSELPQDGSTPTPAPTTPAG
jgi:protein-disulfide isomerase